MVGRRLTWPIQLLLLLMAVIWTAGVGLVLSGLLLFVIAQDNGSNIGVAGVHLPLFHGMALFCSHSFNSIRCPEDRRALARAGRRRAPWLRVGCKLITKTWYTTRAQHGHNTVRGKWPSQTFRENHQTNQRTNDHTATVVVIVIVVITTSTSVLLRTRKLWESRPLASRYSLRRNKKKKKKKKKKKLIFKVERKARQETRHRRTTYREYHDDDDDDNSSSRMDSMAPDQPHDFVFFFLFLFFPFLTVAHCEIKINCCAAEFNRLLLVGPGPAWPCLERANCKGISAGHSWHWHRNNNNNRKSLYIYPVM